MNVIRIKNWSDIYENNRTRELKSLQWIPIPAKLDGDGYTMLMERKDGPALYGAWIAMAILAGRCDPRGTLVRSSGTPHDSDSIARITRIEKSVIQKMISFAAESLKWLEFIDLQSGATVPHEGATIPQDTSLLGREGRKEGKEGKGVRRPPPAASEFDRKIARRIFDALVKPRGGKAPDFESWAGEIRKAREIDRRPESYIEETLEAVIGHDFWKRNILSAATLRTKMNESKINPNIVFED